MIRVPHPRIFAIWVLLIGFDVGIQVLMKFAGDQLGGIEFGTAWFVAAATSWMVWIALIGYFATFVLWLAILHASPLSAAFPATALVYVLVPLCGWVFLKEDFNWGQAAGIGLILVGVILQRESGQPDPAPSETLRG
ncbi:MAG: EamA family transporter [Betaproteobacteria bacterium]